ncbi:MAG: ImmA/IrrE family metallo-endopeptidase [Cytophagia bacterium]|nr:ImmA/IrrE family metallo-endopeptidase [Cytophagia bacterium]
MATNRRGSARAKKLLADIGFDEVTDIDMEILVSGLGATLIEEPLLNADGKIIRGNSKTLIKVNSVIPYEAKRRFTIAHEIGHYLLHDKLEVHNENSNTLNWFNDIETTFQRGIQEFEANDFASELLMPEVAFRKEIEGNYFSPDLFSHLSERFGTSITSTVYRILDLNIHPVLIVFIHDGKVRYWKKSPDLWCRVKDINKLPPPDDSVAREYIDAHYEFVYSGDEKQQSIYRSTWFELNEYQEDSEFFEYCIPTKQYKTIISVIWEN